MAHTIFRLVLFICNTGLETPRETPAISHYISIKSFSKVSLERVLDFIWLR